MIAAGIGVMVFGRGGFRVKPLQLSFGESEAATKPNSTSLVLAVHSSERESIIRSSSEQDKLVIAGIKTVELLL